MTLQTITPAPLDAEQLNEVFALENILSFKTGEADIPLIEVKNQFATATISLQGAHILSWLPAGEEEVIWVSEAAKFAPGKSVRGGIPVCWPWFGAHDSNSEFPAHGFARTVNWQVLKTETIDDGSTRISFTTQPTADNQHMWPADTTVEYKVTIGKKLEMELITHNKGNQAITIGQALHTYFKVGDVSKTLIHGLDETDYLDKLEDFKRKLQTGPVIIQAEVDRIYLDTLNDCVIEDRQLKRNIVIIKCGSH